MKSLIKNTAVLKIQWFRLAKKAKFFSEHGKVQEAVVILTIMSDLKKLISFAENHIESCMKVQIIEI